MNRTAVRALVVVEVLLCFGLPLYALLWGLAMLPIYFGGVALDSSAWGNVLSTLGGLIGAWALIRALIFCLSGDGARKPNLIVMTLAGCVGWLALLTVVTGQFNPMAVVMTTAVMMLPSTASALHLAIWTFRKARRIQSSAAANRLP